MPLVDSRPLTPGQRFLTRNKQDVSNKKPERRLTTQKHNKKGRNCYGRITSRRRGGGHKRTYRIIDFRRDKFDIPAKVQAIEYDPNRSANLALLAYADGEKRYILAPRGVKVGDVLLSVNKRVEFNPGYCMPLALIPPATKIHAIELHPGRGAQIARSAGQAAQLVNVDGERATIKLPSGEIRYLNAKCRATIGEVGNHEHEGQSLGKAGRRRWLGRRPRVRGVAMNPVDHPMGGGEGRTSGGGHPQSPWGQLSKGFPTRKKSNPTNSQILVRRNGRPMKRK
ncbi:50S ribosomal protein L2 [Coraliomargarita parva]|uniref:50S ribosomal protein L2 n=1 Tax=Coraliomargarita parva TaxID=3014050 RepID=UPI0022B5672F|nr:50S ribosomal protein L2 [Coraliomargarita parva]